MGIVWGIEVAILPRTEMVRGHVRHIQSPYLERSVMLQAKYLSVHQAIMGRMPPASY